MECQVQELGRVRKSIKTKRRRLGRAMRRVEAQEKKVRDRLNLESVSLLGQMTKAQEDEAKLQQHHDFLEQVEAFLTEDQEGDSENV